MPPFPFRYVRPRSRSPWRGHHPTTRCAAHEHPTSGDQRCVFPRKDDRWTTGRQREPKLASLGAHAAFQRQFWRPNSHFSWVGASGVPLLVARNARSCGHFGHPPHAAVASPRVRKLPHKCTQAGRIRSISAPELPQARVFLPPSGPRAEYFCTGRESWPTRR
jgi:hypothetical protein